MGGINLLSIVVSALLVWSSTWSGAVDVEEQDQESPTVVFIATEDAGFDEVFDSLLASNDAGDVAEFLDAQASAADPVTDDLGLDEIGLDDAREVLADAAASAEEVAEAEPSDDVATAGAALLVVPAAAVQQTTPSSAASTIVRASVSSAGVAGNSVKNRFSWAFSNRAYLRECSGLFCTTKSWLDYYLETDPGKTGSRTYVKFIKGGEGKIRGVKLRTVVLAAGSNISDVTKTWSTPVNGLYQWNTPHASTKGKTFQMYYWLEFSGPGLVTGSYEYKSGKSSACAEPSPGAYRCLFP